MKLRELVTEEKSELFEGLEGFDIGDTYYEDMNNPESSTIYWYDEIGALHHYTF